jgi:hypothetical protein
MLLSTAISAVQAQFDSTSTLSSDAVVRSWINDVVQEAVGEAKWLKKSLSLGPTVAGQSEYALPTDGTTDATATEVVDIVALNVDSSKPWLRISTQEMWELQAGASRLSWAAGAYAPNFQTDTDPVVELYPAPEEAGLTIEALAAVLPLNIGDATSGATVLPLPDDVAGKIAVDGAIALGLTRLQEDTDPTPFRARFLEGKAELKRRANTRIGSGPTRVRFGR